MRSLLSLDIHYYCHCHIYIFFRLYLAGYYILTDHRKGSKTLATRGSKMSNDRLPISGDLQRETFELGALFKYLEISDDPDSLPENIVTANVYKRLEICKYLPVGR